MLGDVGGARVLDLYAGSGALGIEALSRGADSAVFVERDAEAVAAIERNLAAVGVEATVVASGRRCASSPARTARSTSCSATLHMILRPVWPGRSRSACRRSPQKTHES